MSRDVDATGRPAGALRAGRWWLAAAVAAALMAAGLSVFHIAHDLHTKAHPTSASLVAYVVIESLLSLLLIVAAIAIWRLSVRGAAAAAQLAASEAQFRAMAESAPVAIWLSDAQGRSIYCNQRWLDLRGTTRQAEADAGWADGLHPDDRARFVDAFSDAVAVRAPFRAECRVQTADGSYRAILVTGTPRSDDNGAFVGYVGCNIDTEDIRRAEAARDESEERLRQIMEQSPAVIYIKNLDGTYMYINRRYTDLFSVTLDDLRGKTDFDIFPPEVAAVLRANDLRIAASGVAERLEESVVFRGERRTYFSVKFPFTDRTGRNVAVCGMSTDITESRARERDLADLRAALESSTDGCARLDADGCYTFVNSAFARSLGGTPEDFIGARWERCIAPDDVPAVRAVFDAARANGRTETQARGRRLDGTQFDVRLCMIAARPETSDSQDPDAPRVGHSFFFLTDLTAVKSGERQLQESYARAQELLRRERTLLRELDHRVRNNLSGLLGLITLYVRSGRDGRGLAEALRGKILAMRDVHDMISRTPEHTIMLRDLLRRVADGALPTERADAVELDGPDAPVGSTQSHAIAIVAQEMFTNACKHGALRDPAGRVRVSWRPAEGRITIIRWTESGPPASSRRADAEHNTDRQVLSGGVGMPLIAGLCASELRGSFEHDLADGGIVATVRAILIDEPPEDAPTRPTPARRNEP